MLAVSFISLIIFISTLLFSYICNIFTISPYILFILPFILITIIIINLEPIILKNNKMSRAMYIALILQIPAIISILISLNLWIFINNQLIIKTFFYSCKYLYVPILLVTFIYEIFKNKDKNIIISFGFVIAFLLVFLIIV